MIYEFVHCIFDICMLHLVLRTKHNPPPVCGIQPLIMMCRYFNMVILRVPFMLQTLLLVTATAVFTSMYLDLHLFHLQAFRVFFTLTTIENISRSSSSSSRDPGYTFH